MNYSLKFTVSVQVEGTVSVQVEPFSSMLAGFVIQAHNQTPPLFSGATKTAVGTFFDVKTQGTHLVACGHNDVSNG